MVATAWWAWSAWMKAKTVTGRSLPWWRTRPALFPESSAPPATCGSPGAGAPTPRARRYSVHPAGGPHPDRPAEPSCESPGAESSNSQPNSTGVRPERTSSTICRLNSSGYLRPASPCHRELLTVTGTGCPAPLLRCHEAGGTPPRLVIAGCGIVDQLDRALVVVNPHERAFVGGAFACAEEFGQR